MKHKSRLPRILKINEIKGLKISVLFSNGQDRILDFEKIAHHKMKVTAKMPAYKLLDPKELKKAKLNNFTLSWSNISTEVKFKDNILKVPFEIGADTLLKWSDADMDREDINVGELLKQVRIKDGMTQEEVAILSGTSRTYISRIENNKSDIELFTLEKIVKSVNRKLRIQIL